MPKASWPLPNHCLDGVSEEDFTLDGKYQIVNLLILCVLKGSRCSGNGLVTIARSLA